MGRKDLLAKASVGKDAVTTVEMAPYGFTTEQLILNVLANVTEFDSVCQFVTKECADAAAIQLAAALRADAEAVTNPSITSSQLREVSQNLANLHANTRTLLNSTELPVLGRMGGIGTCALLTDGEFSDTGERYDASISRFASAINYHQTLVHCGINKHYCRMLHRKGGSDQFFDTKVRLDAQSYLLAVQAGEEIHRILSSDFQLRDGVAHWGSASKPTHAFVTTLMLLRSGLCTRLDAYGQPGVPLSWYRASGIGQVVVAPGPSEEERELAKVLVQERYFLRVAMDSRRMCYFR
mmetsp:Transcript_24199/g.78870  ORF Transcript_24199/g.78870 Transcript_24199/m.78870 type:complete len:295 (-) Transcript_24199:407-1291(-)